MSARYTRLSGLLACSLSLVTPNAVLAGITRSKTAHRQPQEFQISANLEYQTSEYSMPLQLEWAPNDSLKVLVETGFGGTIADSGKWERGLLDTEVGATYEFMHERRTRPSLALQIGFKLPTARNKELGTQKTDYSLGLVAAKEYVNYDLELSANYTIPGNPTGLKLDKVLEISLAGEWHRRQYLDLMAQLTATTGGNIRRGSGLGGLISAAENSGNTEVELILGVAETRRAPWKFEQGVSIKSDGTFLILLGCEYHLGSDR